MHFPRFAIPSRRQFLIGGAAAALASSRAFAQSKPTLYFSAIPDADERKLMARFSKIADYLSSELGVPVEYIPLKSYPAAVTAFRNDQVQLAWFGGLTAVQALRAVPDSRVLAQGVEDKSFVSYFIANAATGIERSPELPGAIAGKTFTFGAKTSTSGRLMPEYYIRERFGKPPEEVFSRVGFSGNHTKTVELVQSGAYQVGAVNYAVYEDMVASGNADPQKVPVIWETPPYQDYNWTIRGDVDEKFGEGFTEKVRQALLDMEDEALLASFPRSGFIPAENSDYDRIEQTAIQIGLIDE